MSEVIALGAGRYQIRDGSRSRIAFAVAEPGRTWVFLDGAVHVIALDVPAEGHRRSHTPDEAALAAPMPATVIEVNVAPGQRVAAGDVLIVLEAMKMELPIKAPRDGTVKSIGCRTGELVQPGRPLLEIE